MSALQAGRLGASEYSLMPSQDAQTTFAASVGGVLTKVPAEQSLTGEHAPFPAIDLKKPVLHTEHTRSEVAVGATACSMPAGQICALMHASWPLSLWKNSELHAVHLVLEVGVGGED